MGSVAAPVKLFNKVRFVLGFSALAVCHQFLVYSIIWWGFSSKFIHLPASSCLLLIEKSSPRHTSASCFRRKCPIMVSDWAWSLRLWTSWSHVWCVLLRWRGLCTGYWESTLTAGKMSTTSGLTASLPTSTLWGGVSWQATSSNLQHHRVRADNILDFSTETRPFSKHARVNQTSIGSHFS